MEPTGPSPALIRRLPALLVGGYALAALLLVALTPPLPQDAAYHAFADRRALGGVPNFGDVASNALLLAAGAAGLAVLRRRPPGAPPAATATTLERGLLAVLFAAVCLTALGSAYYHLAPDNPRLFWDRLPLGLIATALPAVLVAGRGEVSRAGRWLLLAWLLVGPLSAVYWALSEALGRGDLRLYGLVQAYAIAASALLLLLVPRRGREEGHYWPALGCYLLAKAFEGADRAVFAAGEVVSGHTLKHVAAALAVAWLVRMLARGRPAGRGLG